MTSDNNSRSRSNKITKRNRRLVRNNSTSQSVARVNTSQVRPSSTRPIRPPSSPTAEEQMLHDGFAFNSFNSLQCSEVRNIDKAPEIEVL
ncbi:4594_t:CDS:2, partial [Racocetra persica]